MGLSRNIKLLALICCINQALAIPSSMVNDIKSRELSTNKVKRVSLPAKASRENLKIGDHYYGNPTAIKRGVEAHDSINELGSSTDNDWNPDEHNVYQNSDNDFQSSWYNDDNSDIGRTVDDYDKSVQYFPEKEKFDDAIENAVLKSGLYSYVNDDNKKRRKRNSRKSGYRSPSAVELTPEEVLDLLSLYENEHQKPQGDFSNSDQDNGIWLDVPVRPRPIVADSSNLEETNYMLDENPLTYENPQWSKYRNGQHFMAKKQSDPTRELRYLTGPSKHDYYSLSQLLNNHRDPNVPVYHRYIL